MPHINQAGLDLLKRFEGCVLTAYRDPVGILTIGFGHTGDDVGVGECINQTEADVLLAKDLEVFEQEVQNQVEVVLNSNQFSALVCFVYNVGGAEFANSTIKRFINANQLQEAAGEFDKWVYAGDKVLPGLVTRREAEKALFLKPWDPLYERITPPAEDKPAE